MTPKPICPSVSANSVAAHLVQITKAPLDRDFERNIKKEKCNQMRRHGTAVESFYVGEVSSALQKMKSGTALDYDNVHPEFLKNLGE